MQGWLKNKEVKATVGWGWSSHWCVKWPRLSEILLNVHEGEIGLLWNLAQLAEGILQGHQPKTRPAAIEEDSELEIYYWDYNCKLGVARWVLSGLSSTKLRSLCIFIAHPTAFERRESKKNWQRWIFKIANFDQVQTCDVKTIVIDIYKMIEAKTKWIGEESVEI